MIYNFKLVYFLHHYVIIIYYFMTFHIINHIYEMGYIVNINLNITNYIDKG